MDEKNNVMEILLQMRRLKYVKIVRMTTINGDYRKKC